MIILDDLNPVFGDYLVELSLGKHVSSLLYGINALGLKIEPWCPILAIVKVDANLSLIVELVYVYIRHLHLFEID